MKVALYCRLSDEDRNKQSDFDDSASIQNQKSMLLSYAISNAWDVYNIYTDEDYTGADRKRPAFNQLLADAENRKFDIVLCKSQSRFTRELELVEKYIHGLFPLWRIRFVSIVDNADTENPGNKKSRQINGLVNEWYLEDLSKNIKDTLTNRRKNGYHIGAFALYGYQKDPARKGHLIIDPEAAETVKEVFTLFSRGYGKTAIARILNDRGVPNPTEYKRLKGLRYKSSAAKHSTLWTYSAISDMLSNEIYIGNLVQGKYGSISWKTKQNKAKPKEEWIRIEGTHEAIIDMPLWIGVQELLVERSKPFSSGRVGLFANKAKCLYCGYVLKSCKTHGKHYLKCGTRHVARDACIGAFISVEALEDAVLNELRKMVDTCLDKEELEARVEFADDFRLQIEKAAAETATYEKIIEDYAKILRELYIDKVKDILSEDDFLALSREFSEKKDRLEHALQDSRKRLETLERESQAADTPQQKIEAYTNIQKLDRETVVKFVDFILVGKKDIETRQIPIEIHWNF